MDAIAMGGEAGHTVELDFVAEQLTQSEDFSAREAEADYANVLRSYYHSIGQSERNTQIHIRAEREVEPEEFRKRALGFVAYREFLISGDYALSFEAFQHSAQKYPGKVMQDAKRWERERAEAEAARIVAEALRVAQSSDAE